MVDRGGRGCRIIAGEGLPLLSQKVYGVPRPARGGKVSAPRQPPNEEGKCRVGDKGGKKDKNKDKKQKQDKQKKDQQRKKDKQPHRPS